MKLAANIEFSAILADEYVLNVSFAYPKKIVGPKNSFGASGKYGKLASAFIFFPPLPSYRQ
jgi:hypothetical protein